jgi:3-phenylpropionate/cinnamic acid dioxygenase small subunit
MDPTEDGAIGVHHLLARLAYATDEGSLDDYVACFTDDAELIVDDPRIAVPGSEGVRGSEKIRAAAAQRRVGNSSGPGSNKRHIVTTIAVRVEGDTASSTASWLLFRDSNDIPGLLGVGQYRDELRRDAQGWRIERRVITRDQA